MHAPSALRLVTGAWVLYARRFVRQSDDLCHAAKAKVRTRGVLTTMPCEEQMQWY